MDIDQLERRLTRSALMEISTPRTRTTNILSEDVRANIARNTSVSPTASPEELIIQQRGRRKMPVTWSPDIDVAKRQSQRTPVKTPLKTTIVLRSTPRKRLLLTDSKDHGGTPEKVPKKTPSPWKKSKSDKTPNGPLSPTVSTSPFQNALKGLSPIQLMGIIDKAVQIHPDLESALAEDMPQPDLQPLEERLSYLKGNIFKSLPTSRLTSKTDSPAYSRAATHVNAFKKCVLDQGKTLLESQHWEAVAEYVTVAWRHVRDTPLWDNPPHNSARKQCFNSLAGMLIHALKRGSWTKAQLEDIMLRFKRSEDDCREAESSVKQIIALCKSKQQ